MKNIIDLLRQLAINAFYPRQVVNTCPGNFPEPAQLLQQLLAPFWTHSGYLLQRRGTPGFRPALPMPGDRKTMRLIPDLLYQVQRR